MPLSGIFIATSKEKTTMKEIKHYYQEHSSGCGPASLLIAYKALGIDYNEVALTLELGITKDDVGADWGQMFYHVATLGFPTELKSVSSYESLKEDFSRGIIIIAWSTDSDTELQPHYSVVSGITDDLIDLTDPGLSIENWPSIIPREEFLSKWFILGYPKSYLLIKPKV